MRFPYSPNDLAIAPDGTIYASDSMAGALFRKKPDETSLNRLATAGALPGANGITIAAGGKLYVAVSTGLMRIDPATGQRSPLAQPDDVATDGIDGLYAYAGDLIGIQNVTNPGRVIRIVLTEGGNRIQEARVLQSSRHPEFAEPTTGALGKDVLYVIANSHVSHYLPDGNLKDTNELKGTAIIAVPLKR